MEPWIQLRNGKAFFPWNPKKEDFDLETIARSLSRIPRFLGHTSEFYSVAQHCCDCLLHYQSMNYVEYKDKKDMEHYINNCKAILFHDAHEAFAFGDIPSPVKNNSTVLNEDYFNENVIADVNLNIDIKIAEWLNIEPDEFYYEIVKDLDMVALATEKRDLMAGGPDWKIDLPAPRDKKIYPFKSDTAYEQFIKLANQLGVY